MQDGDNLSGKKVLLVDDEPDILETVEELLPLCLIDRAHSFEGGRRFLEKNQYDAAIFDIMGVKGYDLLKLATNKGIPVLMLTAHALSPENLVKSVKQGAAAYVPKDKIADISLFLEDVLEAREKGEKRLGKWFERLDAFFEQKFGEYWKEKSDADFWKKYY